MVGGRTEKKVFFPFKVIEEPKKKLRHGDESDGSY